MAAAAAQTVTYLAAAGQTIGAIMQNVRSRLAGQAGNSFQSGYMNLGTVKDSSGNQYDLVYDPVANVIISAAL